MRIAIIEDSPLVLDNLLKVLAEADSLMVVGHAGSEDEGYRLVIDHRPDLVLLDLGLASGSGLNLLKRLRATPGLAPRVLVLSNQPADAYEAPCLAAGADGFFDKCDDVALMLAWIASWLPPTPVREARRLRVVHRLHLLDTPPEDAFDGITRLAAAIVGAPIAMLTVLDGRRQWIKSRVGTQMAETSRSISFCAHAIVGESLLEVEDASCDQRFATNPLVRGEPHIRFYAGMPVVMPDGEAIGALCVIDREPRRLDVTQRMALEVLARSVSSELAWRGRMGVLEAERADPQDADLHRLHLAMRDPLTALPNRAALIDRLQQCTRTAAREDTQLAVLLLGLDRFKWINDTLGHDAGDALLQQIALRLSGVVRESDTVARVGGDEFAFVLPALSRVADAEQVAVKLIEAVRQPMMLDGHAVHVGASIGIACYPADGAEGAALFRHADVALFHAKQAGGNQYRIFDQGMKVRALERMTLEADLRLAIDRGELELHYQPQFGLGDNALMGVEALVRWNHPRLGKLFPDRFITLAEETGLIWPLGLKVLDLAIAQIAAWDRAGLQVPRVAVNVSPSQLREELVEAISLSLTAHGVAPSRLEIELTENALTADGPAVVGLLQRLRRMGVTIAVDDFGVGYSSLALLRRLPINTLKIDRSFVIEIGSNAQDMAIVQAILTMADSIGLRTVAEGVEDTTQHMTLVGLACKEAQGYLYSRPVDAERMTGLLQQAWLKPRVVAPTSPLGGMLGSA